MKTSRERQTKNAHFKISMSEKYSLMRYKPDLKYVIKADKHLIGQPLNLDYNFVLSFCTLMGNYT